MKKIYTNIVSTPIISPLTTDRDGGDTGPYDDDGEDDRP